MDAHHTFTGAQFCGEFARERIRHIVHFLIHRIDGASKDARDSRKESAHETDGFRMIHRHKAFHLPLGLIVLARTGEAHPSTVLLFF